MINFLLSARTLLLLAAETELPPTLWDNLLFPLLVILILVGINGFFVAAEFAILGSRASRMEQLGEEGNKLAQKIQGILEDPKKQNSYIATSQLGITIVTLVLAAIAEPRIAWWLEYHVIAPLSKLDVHDTIVTTSGSIIALVILTYFHVVIGEMVPKSVALSDPNYWVMRVDPLMSLLQKIFSVPITVLNATGDMLLRLFRIPAEHGAARLYSSEEIEQLITESKKGGLITGEAEEIIRNIFDFHDRAVDQVMTPRRKIQAISSELPYPELIKLVTNSRHSRFPVYEGDLDHVIGILHLKDLLRYYRSGKDEFVIHELLRPTPVILEDYMITDLLSEFKRDHQHMAIVLDEYGGTAGLVTLEDLVEEIIGEVRDEFDIERDELREISPGVIEISGDYLLDDLKDIVFLGEDDTLPDVDTVAGLVITHLGAPPHVEDRISLKSGVEFCVIEVEGRAITRLRVEYPTLEEKDGLDSAESSH